jgi:hypothetical protein
MRENYQSALLIGNDNKMNGTLISIAPRAKRKTLRIVELLSVRRSPNAKETHFFGSIPRYVLLIAKLLATPLKTMELAVALKGTTILVHTHIL